MFDSGDIVHLKSGSPKMTVTAVSGGPVVFFVTVTWIHFNSGEVKSLTAPHTAFEAIVPKADPRREARCRYGRETTENYYTGDDY